MIPKWDMDIPEWTSEKQIYNNFKQILTLKIIAIFGRLYVELKQICAKLFKTELFITAPNREQTKQEPIINHTMPHFVAMRMNNTEIRASL